MASLVRQTGSSLVEMLVAMALTAIGMLALSSGLVSATRLSQASEHRTMASLLAADISERIRANPAGRVAYRKAPTDIERAAPGPAPGCRHPGACLPSELAAVDLAQWSRVVFDSLPGGTTYLAQADDGQPGIDAWVLWREPLPFVGAGLDHPDGPDPGDGRSPCPPGFEASPMPRCLYFRVGW